MKARFLKMTKMRELVCKIDEHLELYRSGRFDNLLSDREAFHEAAVEIDEGILGQVRGSPEDLNEVDSCMKVYSGIGRISEYFARDERLWTYLTHTSLLEYTRSRWPIPAEADKAVKHIKDHFFCNGDRGIRRNNAASRLWWLASICSRCEDLPLNEALECLLHHADVRANIVERPTTAQNVRIFNSILRRLHHSMRGDKALFERERFRQFMRNLNVQGGVKLLAAMPETRIEEILDACVPPLGAEAALT
ncbi:MAG: hypothetical protein RL417_1915 [Pseudomonadota bacterium]|jgi:hypothetical protein